MSTEGNVTVIKRYANRKLYSLETSQYITLGDVFGYVEQGTPIQVVSNGTNEDLTSHTILSALAERGKGLSGNDVSQLLVKVANYIGNTGVGLEVPVISNTPTSDVTTNIGGLNE